jgi:hypothetical protein
MESNMLKYAPIFAAFLAFMTVPASAQQQEALLHKTAIAGAGLDIIIAMPKTDAPTVDYRSQPDPNIFYLAEGRLLVGVDNELEVLLDSLVKPVWTSSAGEIAGHDPQAIAIFLVPNGLNELTENHSE